MYAVEFEAKIQDGLIEIPPRYRDKLTPVVRVILLSSKREEQTNVIDQLVRSPLKVDGFRPLPRDDIYART